MTIPGPSVTLGGSVLIAEDDYPWLSCNSGWFGDGRRRRLYLAGVQKSKACLSTFSATNNVPAKQRESRQKCTC